MRAIAETPPQEAPVAFRIFDNDPDAKPKKFADDLVGRFRSGAQGLLRDGYRAPLPQREGGSFASRGACI